jgi:NAD(P)-dependent dehydrogenase (short-subunit alcohol dehydrogenase family)
MSINPKKIVVVTGGASGIGAACAVQLHRAGWMVVVADINESLGREVAGQIGGCFVPLDVSKETAIHAAAVNIEQEVGPVHALVNSAGIIQKPLPPHELSIAEWDRIQQINYRGTYIACVEFARHMLQRRAGAIVNITSITDRVSTPLHAYGPGKAAIVSLTQCLAAEWGPSGLRVNSVAPGYTLTPALLGAIERGERKLDQLENNAALKRAVQPQEIGAVVEFLLSERASAITGVDLPVDCGWLVANPWHTYGGLREAHPSSSLSQQT